MTVVWGPMGWITLHSISVNYPETPSAADKIILRKFINLFSETISCPSCRGHFISMYNTYISRNPSWANSKYDLFLFVVRAHNTVNKRIDKPCPASVSEALSTLQAATRLKSPKDYRTDYISYLYGNWSRQGGGEGYIQTANVREMQKINNEYWNPRETGFSISFPEANVLQLIMLPSAFPFPHMRKAPPVQPTQAANKSTSVGLIFKDGRLKLANI